MLPYLFAFWAMPHQLAPEGDWRTWVILGGRGAGKTRAGAEWVRTMVEGPTQTLQGQAQRIALVGETIEQAREVMIFGESGILAMSPPAFRPDWVAGRKMLQWENGATAQLFSAFDPESLRGPQFDGAWVDELAKWPHPDEAWDMLQFGLRLGEAPRATVTTTPRNVPLLRRLLETDSTRMTRATTFDNAANLAPSFLKEVQGRYAGTRLGRQELDGALLTDVQGGLWDMDDVARQVVSTAPEMDRIVVAVDPPVSGHARSDACGIIVAGVVMKGPPYEWRAYVLEDASVAAAAPLTWAKAAVAALHRHQADRLVAEVNQGGDLVETVIRSVDPLVPVKGLHASRGKAARAEPVAALYAQGRVAHVRGLQDLEAEMGQMTLLGFEGKGSPDRVDALVWALTELMLIPAKSWAAPQVRGL
ncbi:DNA-packaging protein [Yoonia sp. R2331]|uniref:DNA-packaging protein n=1 Tax=Yoonia sp. R2331 TaxID=3237238 RepID=UPI0034E3A475